MSLKIDNHQFYIETKKLEASVAEKAHEKATKYQGQNLASWTANSISKEISKEAYEDFEKKVVNQFEDASYKVLISLLLKSRVAYFANSLPESIKVTILNEKRDPGK
jgi:hypothetical protein